MKNQQDRFEKRREHKRDPILKLVRWNNRFRENQQGEIHDISPSGTFLRPLGTMPNNIGADDTIWISLLVGRKEHSLSARVRWRGVSTEHSENGFGLEFDENSKEIAKDLYLQIS